jgi:hypothetical protein
MGGSCYAHDRFSLVSLLIFPLTIASFGLLALRLEKHRTHLVFYFTDVVLVQAKYDLIGVFQ